MGPCRALPSLLLLLLGLGLAGAATPGSTLGWDGATQGWEGTTASSLGFLSYGDVVAAAVELLNARAVSPYVLRLREAQPRPGWVSAELSLFGTNSRTRRNSRTGQCWIRPFSGWICPVLGLTPVGLSTAEFGAEPDPFQAGRGPFWGWALRTGGP